MPEIPDGLCQCGCGQKTTVPKKSNRKEGRVAGVPMRYVSGHNHPRRPFASLESRYEMRDCGYETPCWVWLRTRSRNGYARMWDPDRRRVVQASRYFYEQFIGPIPDCLQIDHLCRNRRCVNPDHLEPVTQGTNQRRGANAKLSDADRDNARARSAQGESIAALARSFGVSWPTMKRATH